MMATVVKTILVTFGESKKILKITEDGIDSLRKNFFTSLKSLTVKRRLSFRGTIPCSRSA